MSETCVITHPFNLLEATSACLIALLFLGFRYGGNNKKPIERQDILLQQNQALNYALLAYILYALMPIVNYSGLNNNIVNAISIVNSATLILLGLQFNSPFVNSLPLLKIVQRNARRYGKQWMLILQFSCAILVVLLLSWAITTLTWTQYDPIALSDWLLTLITLSFLSLYLFFYLFSDYRFLAIFTFLIFAVQAYGNYWLFANPCTTIPDYIGIMLFIPKIIEAPLFLIVSYLLVEDNLSE